MAMRRLARHGLQLVAEQQQQQYHQPIASTSQLVVAGASCPGCRRGLVHAVPFAHAGSLEAAADKSSTADTSTAKSDPGQAPPLHGQPGAQGSGGRWASLFFPSPTTASAARAPAPTPSHRRAGRARRTEQLSASAAALIQELQRQRPDPHRTWDLFTQLDLDGHISSLSRETMSKILPALYTRAPAHRSVQTVTAAARAYQTKADLVRLRLRQAGMAPTRGELAALVRQFHALRYAPGMVRAWDAFAASGLQPTPADCEKAFEALSGWVELHGRAAGRAVERAVAESLAAKAAEMLFLDIGLSPTSTTTTSDKRGDNARRCVDVVLEPFFRLVIKAGDHTLFARAFKKLYGFDVALPGALLDASAAERAQLRTIGERELCWILESLADQDNLPGLIAAFETFDQPIRDPVLSTALASASGAVTQDFFTPGSTTTLNDASTDRQPAAPPTSEADAHLVGTRAFTILIQAASRLGNAPIARHYFDLLFMRWTGDADQRLQELEEAVGMVEVKDDEWVDDAPAPDLEDTKPVELAASPDAAAAASTARPARFRSTSSIPHSVSLVSQFGAHLTPAPSAPSKPYVVPSALIAHVAHHAKAQYDASTARWLRGRTRRVLQTMESHMARIQAVLGALDVPSENNGGESGAVPADTATAAAAEEPQSVTELRRELALLAFHLDQVRLTLSSVKADERIVTGWKVLHARQAALSARQRRLAQPGLSRRESLRLSPGIRRKSWQVLHAKMLLVRHRIQKLRDVDGARAGDVEYDKWVAEYRALRARAFPVNENEEASASSTAAGPALAAEERA